jgi:hypothetical protein
MQIAVTLHVDHPIIDAPIRGPRGAGHGPRRYSRLRRIPVQGVQSDGTRFIGGGEMRGTDRTQSMMFSYVSPEARIPGDHPLRATREMTNRRSASRCCGSRCGVEEIALARYLTMIFPGIWARGSTTLSA